MQVTFRLRTPLIEPEFIKHNEMWIHIVSEERVERTQKEEKVMIKETNVNIHATVNMEVVDQDLEWLNR